MRTGDKCMKDNNGKFEETRKGVKIVNITFKIIVMIVMIIYAISLLALLFWMVMSSLKAQDDFLLYPFQFPKSFQFSNYAEVFQKMQYTVTKPDVGRITYGLDAMFFYSLVWSVFTNLIPIFFYILTSYVMAKYDFPGKNFIYAAGIVLMILPIYGTGPASLRVAKAVGMYNNMLPRILMSGSGAWYGFNFILLYGVWKSIPWSMRRRLSSTAAAISTHFFG